VSPSAPALGGLAHYSGEGSGRGFEFDFPAAWKVIGGYHEVARHLRTLMVAVGVGDFDLACTGSFPGAIDCQDYRWTVPDDGVVFVYRLEDWPQGPIEPYPSPEVLQGDKWVEIDGRTALFSQAGQEMRWDVLGTPEVIEARFGAAAIAAPEQIQAVIDAWKWREPAATERPSPIVTGSGPATYEWQKVGEAQGGIFPIWAPDSNHVLIDIQAANEFDQVTLLDRTGNSVANVTGINNPMWLDSGTLVAYEDSWPAATASDRAKYHTVVGRAISASDGTVTSFDLPCCFPMPNGHGAIAITRFVSANQEDEDVAWPKTVIWQDGVQSAELDVVPLGWDLAGDKFAVIKPSQPSWREYTGQVQVFTWPGLTPAYESTAKDRYDATFDPTGTYVTGTYSLQDEDDEWHMEIDIVDLTSGAMTTIPVQGDPTKVSADPVWNEQGQLLVADQGPRLLTYRPDGSPIDTEPLSRPIVLQASADSSTIVSYRYDNKSDDPIDFQVLSGTDWRPMTFPFGPSWHGIQLSPDGSQVFASTNTDVGVAGYLADIP
jgi:hypothetical protein